MWHEWSCTTRGFPSDFVIPHNKCDVVLETVKDEALAGGRYARILDRFCARRFYAIVGRYEEAAARSNKETLSAGLILL